MSRSHHELAREFFEHLSRGDLPDDLFTEDAAVWTNSSGASTKARYQGGVKFLQTLFRDGRIAAVAEHCDPMVVREKIVPLLQAAARR